jgi:hypothetical protein
MKNSTKKYIQLQVHRAILDGISIKNNCVEKGMSKREFPEEEYKIRIENLVRCTTALIEDALVRECKSHSNLKLN